MEGVAKLIFDPLSSIFSFLCQTYVKVRWLFLGLKLPSHHLLSRGWMVISEACGKNCGSDRVNGPDPLRSLANPEIFSPQLTKI